MKEGRFRNQQKDTSNRYKKGRPFKQINKKTLPKTISDPVQEQWWFSWLQLTGVSRLNLKKPAMKNTTKKGGIKNGDNFTNCIN